MKHAAVAVVFDKSKTKVLLVKRKDVPVWVLPGGGVDTDETAEEAVLREVWEETGLRVNIVKKIANYTPINALAEPTSLFECTVLDGTIRKNSEAADVGFRPLESTTTLLFSIHQEWLQDAKLFSPITLNKKLESVTYFNLFCYLVKHPLQVLRFAITRMNICVHKSDQR